MKTIDRQKREIGFIRVSSEDKWFARRKTNGHTDLNIKHKMLYFSIEHVYTIYP
jgi:hypothetical protein